MTKMMRVRDDAPERARVEPTAPSRHEQRVLGAPNELRTAVPEIPGEPVRRFLAQGDDPLLAALAEHANRLLLEVDVREIELHRLLRAQAGRVDELPERAVAKGDRAFALERLQLAVDVIGLGDVRKALRPTR